jgi:hypothetical protein
MLFVALTADQAVDTLRCGMKPIKAQFVASDQVNDQAGADADGKAQNIDQGIPFLVDEVPPGRLEVVVEHASRFEKRTPGAAKMLQIWPPLRNRVKGNGHLGPVAGPEGIDHRSGREYLYPIDPGQADPVVVSLRGPAKEKPVCKKIRFVMVQDERTGREVADRFGEGDLGAAPVDPLLL